MYRFINHFAVLFLLLIFVPAAYPSQIGFLAPLTGKYANFSEEFLKGASIAAYLDNSSIIVADNQGKPFYTNYQLRWLVGKGINKIIGPIFYINAKSIKQLLKQYNVVAAVPSGAKGKMFISLSISSDIANLMAELAIKSGAKTISIIYPRNEKFKTEIAKKFYSFVLSQNRIVKLNAFDTNNPTLLNFVKKSFNIRKTGKDQFSCDLPDLVFLDSSIENGKKLLSLFKYYECMPETILVLPFWYDNAVLKSDSSLTKNVVVASIFYKQKDSLSKQFFELFVKRFGYKPTIANVVGFDMAFYLINHEKAGNEQIKGISTLVPGFGPKSLIFLKIKEHRFVKAENLQNR